MPNPTIKDPIWKVVINDCPCGCGQRVAEVIFPVPVPGQPAHELVMRFHRAEFMQFIGSMAKLYSLDEMWIPKTRGGNEQDQAKPEARVKIN